jgi:two-component SAPR family response regulator
MKIRAFVFEDDENVLFQISSILIERGYEVLHFPEPLFCPVYLNNECQCHMEYMCGDIFIIDINMSNLTGLDFIEKLIWNGCKVISQNKALIMSDACTDAELKRAKILDCHIFYKPLTYDEIIEWLDKCEKRIDPNRKLVDRGMLFQRTTTPS